MDPNFGEHSDTSEIVHINDVSQNLDGVSKDKDDIYVDHPTLVAGYIVGERPIYLANDSIICVVNNQKCSLYDSESGFKIFDTNPHDDMIVSVCSFLFKCNRNILISASYDGLIKVYLVSPGVPSAGDGEIVTLLAKVWVTCEHFLYANLSKKCGSVVCVYSTCNNRSRTEISVLSLDYDSLISMHDEATCGSEVVEIKFPFDQTNLNSKENSKLVQAFNRVCSLTSKIDVFATHSSLEAIGIGIGSTVIILLKEYGKIIFFDSPANISCMDFKSPTHLAFGDSTGRIFIYEFKLDLVKSYNQETLVMMCDMPDESSDICIDDLKGVARSILSPGLANKLTSNAKKDIVPYKNPRRISVRTTTLIWHAHGVGCLVFNTDGTTLLSGGEEGVLVIWHLASGNRRFVTRIGSAIFHLAVPLHQGPYVVSCEANEIFFIDPFALCINNRISGLTIPVSVGMRTTQNINRLYMENYMSATEISEYSMDDITKANITCSISDGTPSVPHLQHWPTSLVDFMSEYFKSPSAIDNCDIIVGGNIVISSRSSKLQIYNYLHDREVGSLDLKNVNVISRQDGEFGQDWDLDQIFINTDGSVMVTVQSRNLLHSVDSNEKAKRGMLKFNSGFEHQLTSNNKKSLLKFWIKSHSSPFTKKYRVKNSAPNDICGYTVNTKISNPHIHKVTSIQQLGRTHAFLTTSLDSEFKVWGLVKKPTFETDDVFASYQTLQLEEMESDILKEKNVDRFVWVCIAVGSYKNLPCFACCITDSGNFIGISHDVAITFWEYRERSMNFVGTLAFKDKSSNNEEGEIESAIFNTTILNFIKFIHPKDSNLLLYCKRTRLCVLDFVQGKAVWEYPISSDQSIDKVIYEQFLPKLCIVSSTIVEKGTGACKGLLEVFRFDFTHGGKESNLRVERIYKQDREISKVILNMCLIHSAVRGDVFKNVAIPSGRDETHVPVFPTDQISATLVLLTSNFNIETMLLRCSLREKDKMVVRTIYDVKKSPYTKSEEFGPIGPVSPLIDVNNNTLRRLMEIQKEQLKKINICTTPEKRKRRRFNLAEQYCKSMEWCYRAENPVPKNLLNSVLDIGCPAHALPSPNVVYNRLVQLIAVRHKLSS